VEENEIESEDLERLCQGVSPGDAACNYPATGDRTLPDVQWVVL
jgi:hypothetical protein